MLNYITFSKFFQYDFIIFAGSGKILSGVIFMYKKIGLIAAIAGLYLLRLVLLNEGFSADLQTALI